MSQINKDYFAKARVGLFTHYTYATYADGKGTNWGGTHYSAEEPRGPSRLRKPPPCSMESGSPVPPSPWAPSTWCSRWRTQDLTCCSPRIP